MNDVSKWLAAGAEVNEGLRLLSIYSKNNHIRKLVTLQPARYGYLLISALKKFADVETRVESFTKVIETPRKAFREDWPFLSDPSCPMELKILATDKITAYHQYIDYHKKLALCQSQEECFETAKNLLEKYMENRQIFSEFAYYKEHHRVLGKHQIFGRSKKFEAYRKMPDFQKAKEVMRLQKLIWKLKAEIRKGDKPQLLLSREKLISEHEQEIAFINELIKPNR